MRPALLALMLCAAPAAADDFTPVLGDTHFGVYSKGRRIGTTSDSLSARGSGADAHYVFSFETHVRYPRGSLPAPTQTTLRAEFDGRPPHALRLATYSEFGRTAARSVTIERTPAGYDTVVSQAGESHRFPSAVTGYTLVDFHVDDFWLNKSPPVGMTLAVTDLLWAEARPDPITLRSCGRVGAFTEFEAVNDRGRLWLGRYDAATRRVVGYVFPTGDEYRAEPPNPTRSLEEPEPLSESASLVPTDRALGRWPNPWLRLTIRGYTGTGLRSGPGQTVERRAEGVWACRLGKGEGIESPVTDDEARAALAETTRFPFRHPKVTELARRAVGAARTPAEKIDRLVRFVHTHVTYESEATPELFELLGTRRGNCQSFALLFVALARAEGIPAREVDGLMYAGDAAGGFGFHRWAEAARDGVWHPVDPTVGLATLDATYLRMDDSAEGMTVTVNEVAWTGGLRGLTPEALGRWFAAHPLVCVGLALMVIVAWYRSRQQIRAGDHLEAPPAEPGP